MKKVSEYYQDGQLKIEGHAKDSLYSLKEGVFYYYDKEGKLEKEVNFKNDKKNGDSKEYYSDGSILTTEYSGGKKIGKQIYFSTNGDILSIKTYIQTYYNSSQLNTWKTYNSTGEIVKDSSCYFEILNSITSISQGEQFDLKIKVPASLYNQYVAIYQCDYMKEFDRRISPENNKVKPCKEGVCSISLKSEEKGDQHIRMIILDFSLDEDGYYNINKIFFQFNYTVI